MIRIAFAGFRHSHILALYDGASENSLYQIVGAFEADRETRENMEERGIRFTYDTYEALLADETVDVVAIGDYYSIRGSRVIEALKHGKHVIADKPLCTTSEEAAEIRRLAEKNGLVVYLMLDLRFYEAFATAKKLIADGAIGKITQIFFQGQHPLMYGERPRWYFEEGKHGGVINDIAIHGIDMVRYLCGLQPKRVLAARAWNAYATEAPHFLDSATFMCELEDGAGLMADVSYASPDGMRYAMPTYWNFQIWGTEGMLNLGRNLPTVTLYKKAGTAPEEIIPTSIQKTMLEDFADCLAKKTDTVIIPAEVLDATDITLAIENAAKSDVM